MRDKNKSINPFPPPLPSPQAQLPSQILHLLRPSGAGGRGMGLAASSSHIVSAAPSSSRSCPAPAWGPSHGRLLQRGSSPRGTVLPELTAPAWVPHGVTSPASKPAPARASHGVTASFGRICPGFGWYIFNFLPSSWYRAVFLDLGPEQC